LHAERETFRITPVADGTKLAVELLVERAAMRGYMLFDIGGYYNGQIYKWFSRISHSLAGGQEQVSADQIPSRSKVRQGCLAGCLVYLIVGAGLGIFAFALDRLLFPQTSTASQGPISVILSIIGLLAGIGAFLYVMVPDAPVARFFRKRIQRNQDKERQ
jgi:hypothetical protein